VVVLAPMRTSDADIKSLLQRKAGWITSQLDSVPPQKERQYVDGEAFYFLGELIRLKLVQGQPARVNKQSPLLYLTSRPERSDQAQRRRQIEAWYRQQAQDYFPSKIQIKAHEMGLIVNETQIKAYKARWGSCTSKGVIQLNWRLIMAPVEVVDYVIVHELCHLQHFNHSPEFWRAVARVCPNYRDHKAWLKRHGPKLILD